MSAEQYWYQEVGARGGVAPPLRRMSRLAWHDQLPLTVDLAIAIVEGSARWMHREAHLTREVYWWWPTHPLGRTAAGYAKVHTDWVMIPGRIGRMAYDLVDRANKAVPRAARPHHEAAVRVLRRWQRSRRWRRQLTTGPRRDDVERLDLPEALARHDMTAAARRRRRTPSEPPREPDVPGHAPTIKYILARLTRGPQTGDGLMSSAPVRWGSVRLGLTLLMRHGSIVHAYGRYGLADQPEGYWDWEDEC